MYSSYAITAASPANPSSSGIQQSATSNFGISAGPQVAVVWKYTTPLDFLTAEVTLVIPATYAVSAANPVRYYHVFDTYLGGSDNGCGVRYTDTNGNQVVGTYPPTSGTTCPSSTSIPAGVSVIESFRERSGMAFSNYCASGWNSFWANGSTNCSILQSANMSNNISTTYQDTGIGIQYNFTAPGTYTFSYDFVAVSYTHLDVYKRQLSRHPPRRLALMDLADRCRMQQQLLPFRMPLSQANPPAPLPLRQKPAMCANNKQSIERTASPVSYTHLDVYKRQASRTVCLGYTSSCSSAVIDPATQAAYSKTLSNNVTLSLIHI